GDHRDLHSFPTRRSSDLNGADLLQLIGLDGGVDENGHRLLLLLGFSLSRGLTQARRRTGAARFGVRQSYAAIVSCSHERSQRLRSEEHTSELQSRENLVC